MHAIELTRAEFTDTRFTDNAMGSWALCFQKSPDVAFLRCVFQANKGTDSTAFILADDGECDIAFTQCTFTRNSGTYFAWGDGLVTSKQCKDEANTFPPNHPQKPLLDP